MIFDTFLRSRVENRRRRHRRIRRAWGARHRFGDVRVTSQTWPPSRGRERRSVVRSFCTVEAPFHDYPRGVVVVVVASCRTLLTHMGILRRNFFNHLLHLTFFLPKLYYTKARDSGVQKRKRGRLWLFLSAHNKIFAIVISNDISDFIIRINLISFDVIIL